MKFIWAIVAALAIPTIHWGQKVTQGRMDSLDAQRIAYIAAYKHLAVIEMYKSGIPASITLAQGLLETGAGTSFLAKTANNHFGMKCGDRWDGPTAHKHDDEFDRKGAPIKSCFRAYDDPAGNFSDHSDFLRDPQKYNRYGSLFLLDPLDYVAWSEGLQASGYSPVGHYSARLIEHIERYRLHELDYRAWDYRAKAPATERITIVNDLRMVRAVEGETVAQVAKTTGIPANQILEFNENHWTATTPITHGTPIYLEPKKEAWDATTLEFYYSHEGKSMFEISQLFGVQETALRERNNMNDLQEPALKAKVRLQGTRLANEKVVIAKQKITSPAPQKPKNKKPPMTPVQSQFPVSDYNSANLNRVIDGNLLTGSPAMAARKIPPAPRAEEISYKEEVVEPVTEAVDTEEQTTPDEERTLGSLIFHDVSKGDTLMSISRKYGVAVGILRSFNELDGDNIRIGQRLRVK